MYLPLEEEQKIAFVSLLHHGCVWQCVQMMEKLSPLIHKNGLGCCKINETKENSPLKLRIIPLKGPDMLLLETSSRSCSSQGVLVCGQTVSCQVL